MATFSNTVTPCSPLQVVNLQGSGKCMAEYIWIGSSGSDLKSRTVVLEEKPSSPDELPIAEIDGSSYGQAAEENCEIYLQPRRIFPDPFRGGDHILVLCDIYAPPMACNSADAWDNLQPHTSNHRAACEAVMHQAAYQQPLFSMQQDYSIYSGGETFEGVTGASFGGLGSAPMPIKGVPAGLSAKASARLGRDVAELHMQACLAAGISYCGSHNTSNHQWAFKIGPCNGLEISDQMCMSRFLLGRVAEHSGSNIIYDSTDGRSLQANKCTISFSTASSRDPISGLSEVQCMMERLHYNHLQHALCYTAAPGTAGHNSGSWHSARDAFAVADSGKKTPNSPSDDAGAAASGGSCGSGLGTFTVGVGNKHASIMVPTSTLINRCGPILDRRPPASSDPYLATMLLVASACGLKLPIPQLDAAQMAAALASASTAAGSSSPAVLRSCGAMPIPATSVHCGLSLDDAGCSLDPSCSYSSSMLCGSADSRDMLLSELDRLDGYRRSGTKSGMKRSHCGSSSGYGYGDTCSDICSDASSPPVMPVHLAAAVDEDMFFE